MIDHLRRLVGDEAQRKIAGYQAASYRKLWDPTENYSEGEIVRFVSDDCGDALFAAVANVAGNDDGTGVEDPCFSVENAETPWLYMSDTPIDLYGNGDPNQVEEGSSDDGPIPAAPGSTWRNVDTGDLYVRASGGAWTLDGAGGDPGPTGLVESSLLVLHPYLGEYDGGVTYAKGDAVQVNADQVMYVSLVDDNAGHATSDGDAWAAVDSSVPLLLRSTVDPTVDPGVAAPVGSGMLTSIEGVGAIYVKASATPADWTAVGMGGGDEDSGPEVKSYANPDAAALFALQNGDTPIAIRSASVYATAIEVEQDDPEAAALYWVAAIVDITVDVTPDDIGSLVTLDTADFLAEIEPTLLGWVGNQATGLGFWNIYGGGITKVGFGGRSVSVAGRIDFLQMHASSGDGGGFTDVIPANSGVWLNINAFAIAS